MRKLLFESLFQSALTEAPPAPDNAGLEELAKRVDRAARRRLGRSALDARLRQRDRSINRLPAH